VALQALSFGSRPGCSSPTATTSGSRSNACAPPETNVVVVDAQTSPFIDITAARMLAELATTLRRDGIELRIARDIGQFRDVIHTAAPEAFQHNAFWTVDEALRADPPRDDNSTHR
jgi:MFS superfamily sulfate permease-like transporter